jgi:glycosyltransferase involved in cell wall biosynthesis
MNKLDVSVIMPAYNQAKYLEQAIVSILDQQFSGTLELIVADDKSSDNTEDVVRKIKDTHPKGYQITYFRNELNLGMARNYHKALSLTQGKYVAFCEGDDYWADSGKIQKQFDFLESNPDYNTCVGRYKILFEKSGSFADSRELFNISKPLSLKNYLAFNFGHTTTFFIRNNFKLPAWVDNWVFSVDQCLVIYGTGDGKIKYFKDFLSVYRMHEKNQTSNSVEEIHSTNNLRFLENVSKDVGDKYERLIINRRKLDTLFWGLEKQKNPFMKMLLKFRYIFQRWYGINVLTKYIQ